MRKQTMAIMGICLLVLVLAFTGYQCGEPTPAETSPTTTTQAEGPSTMTEPPTTTPASPSISMATYESTEHGFSVKYPQGWTESEQAGGAHYSLEFKEPEGRLFVEVSVDYKTEEATIDELVSEGKGYLEALPQYELASEGSVTIGEGISGYELVGKGDIGTGKVEKFRYVVLVRGQQGFWVGARGEPTYFDQQEQLTDAIVNSFRLLATYTFVPPAPSAGGTYTSAEYGFSITYPEGWIESPPSGRPGEIISLASMDGLPGVSVSVTPVGEGTTLAEYGPQVTEGISQHWSNYNLFSEGEVTLDDGTIAYEILFSGTSEGYSLKCKYVIVVQDTQAFIIMGYSSPARFEQDENIINEVIYSFHLE